MLSEKLEELRKICGVDEELWKRYAPHHEALWDIYCDHRGRSSQLNTLAQSLSAMLQQMDGVHSVRWRVKAATNLINKIIRKKEQSVQKYNDLSVDNYRDVITDLIGIRVLHLTKDGFANIHSAISKTWNMADGEVPVAYVRNGDAEELKSRYRGSGLRVEEHLEGYRSIHYIISTNTTKEEIKCELQVRTLFEEGWSEIDHVIRYPNFSDNVVVKDFLDIFNRIAGTADEMATFVSKLSASLVALEDAKIEAEEHLQIKKTDFDKKIEELQSKYASENADLKRELEKLKRSAKPSDVLNKANVIHNISLVQAYERAGVLTHDATHRPKFRTVLTGDYLTKDGVKKMLAYAHMDEHDAVNRLKRIAAMELIDKENEPSDEE